MGLGLEKCTSSKEQQEEVNTLKKGGGKHLGRKLLHYVIECSVFKGIRSLGCSIVQVNEDYRSHHIVHNSFHFE